MFGNFLHILVGVLLLGLQAVASGNDSSCSNHPDPATAPESTKVARSQAASWLESWFISNKADPSDEFNPNSIQIGDCVITLGNGQPSTGFVLAIKGAFAMITDVQGQTRLLSQLSSLHNLNCLNRYGDLNSCYFPRTFTTNYAIRSNQNPYHIGDAVLVRGGVWGRFREAMVIEVSKDSQMVTVQTHKCEKVTVPFSSADLRVSNEPPRSDQPTCR